MIDYLGCEQIVDVFIVVLELWKNFWDVYLCDVKFYVFCGEFLVVVMIDDGYGMCVLDLFDCWLVIGMESKFLNIQFILVVDCNGLLI